MKPPRPIPMTPVIPVSEVVWVPLLRLPWRPDWKDKKR